VTRRRRARLVGTHDGALRGLLADVLHDEGVELDDSAVRPDLVLVVGTRNGLPELLVRAGGVERVLALGSSLEPLRLLVRDVLAPKNRRWMGLRRAR
jgi:hypothetical protein